MTMKKKIDVLGIGVNNYTMEEALGQLGFFLTENRTHVVYTPNAEIIMKAQRERELLDIINEADMVVADGAGVVLGSRILGESLPERIAGFDLVKNSFDLGSSKKIKYFFFGGKPGIAEEASSKVLRDYPNVDIVGWRDGYFCTQDEENIINEINDSGADILLVALGAPKQEKWIHKHKNNIKAKVCIGVGGSFDILSGRLHRAPEFFRNNGLEWLYRLYKEPWRIKRMMDLPKFIFKLLAKRILREHFYFTK